MQTNSVSCSNLKRKTRSDFKWTKSAVLKEAKKYKRPYHFQTQSKGAYCSAQQNGWLKEACKHMDSINIWNKESAFLEAKKYKYRKDFRKHSRGAYQFLIRKSKKIFDEACSHMENRFVWDDESAINYAKKFKTRQEFRSDNEGCYTYLSRKRLIEKACSHMESVINHVEKSEQGVFEEKLREFFVKNKLKFVILKEFRVCDKTTHRVDLLINIIPLGFKIAIEYKADSKHWRRDRIEEQRLFYHKKLKKYNVKETYLISKNGKYGWSESYFLEKLNKMIKTKKVEKYQKE